MWHVDQTWLVGKEGPGDLGLLWVVPLLSQVLWACPSLSLRAVGGVGEGGSLLFDPKGLSSSAITSVPSRPISNSCVLGSWSPRWREVTGHSLLPVPSSVVPWATWSGEARCLPTRPTSPVLGDRVLLPSQD